MIRKQSMSWPHKLQLASTCCVICRAERVSGPGEKGERVAVKCVDSTIPKDIVEQEAMMLTQLQRVRRTTCIPPFYGVHMAEQDQTDAPSYLIMG